jgi:MFS family permease
LRWRLSTLLFLVYAPPGAVLPQLAVHLKEIGFTDEQIGAACATQALGALLAPLVAGQAADRWLRAERCLAFCAFLASALLWALASCREPAAFFAVSLAFWLVMAPVMTLASAISFTHLLSPQREFGRVRLWGTVGWVVQGWLIGYWFSRPAWLGPSAGPTEMADIFRLGALMALLLGLYALTLPATPPGGSDPFGPRLATLKALRLLRRRAFAVFFVCNFSLCLTLAFAAQTTPLLLRQLGVSRAWLGPVLTIAQSTEVVALGVLPLMLTHWGQRPVMLAGAIAWAAALAVLTVGSPLGLVVGSLSLNGLFICCFLVAGQVFVNSQASRDIRASAQAMVSVTNGLGMLGGNLLAGWVRGLAGERLSPTFGVAAVIAVAALAVFAVGFRHDPLPPEEAARAEVEPPASPQ